MKSAITPWKIIQTPKCSDRELSRKNEVIGNQLMRTALESSCNTSSKQHRAFVILTLRELGFTNNPHREEFMSEKFCSSWSKTHLNDQTIKLCTLEDAVHLRIQYKNQPENEELFVAMKPAKGFDVHFNYTSGNTYRNTYNVYYDFVVSIGSFMHCQHDHQYFFLKEKRVHKTWIEHWNLDTKIVFRIYDK